MNPTELADRLMTLSIRVGKVVDALPETRLGKHIAGQLIRCGTSAPPNYEEACAAESRRDFCHKLAICVKELRETCVWLRMIIRAELLPQSKMATILNEAVELSKILGKSLVTSRRSARRAN